MKHLYTLAFAASVAVGFMFGTSTSLADVNFYPYIRPSPGAADNDPINMLFTINGDVWLTALHIRDDTGYGDECSSPEYFGDHGVWQLYTVSLASGNCFSAPTRDHIRLNQQDDNGPSGYDKFTMGPAHYEELVGGCHIVRSFNAARDRIQSRMQFRGHSIEWVYWGNNAARYEPCDGTWVAGDGWIARVVIP
jgi:hypothetical protein